MMEDQLVHVGQEIVRDAEALAREVTDRLSELAREEPWLEPLTRVGQDHLPELIRALARLALVDPDSLESADELIEASQRHGADRRREGHADSVIPAEYVLLRRSLRNILVRQRRTAPDLLLTTLALLEAAIGVAEIGSLHGYHAQDGMPSRGGRVRALEEWTGLVHEVLEGS